MVKNVFLFFKEFSFVLVYAEAVIFTPMVMQRCVDSIRQQTNSTIGNPHRKPKTLETFQETVKDYKTVISNRKINEDIDYNN